MRCRLLIVLYSFNYFLYFLITSPLSFFFGYFVCFMPFSHFSCNDSYSLFVFLHFLFCCFVLTHLRLGLLVFGMIVECLFWNIVFLTLTLCLIVKALNNICFWRCSIDKFYYFYHENPPQVSHHHDLGRFFIENDMQNHRYCPFSPINYSVAWPSYVLTSST